MPANQRQVDRESLANHASIRIGAMKWRIDRVLPALRLGPVDIGGDITVGEVEAGTRSFDHWSAERLGQRISELQLGATA